MIHTGNSFIREEDGVLVVDATIYEDKNQNQYEQYDFEKLRNEEGMKNR
jgi:hypothetical protein